MQQIIREIAGAVVICCRITRWSLTPICPEKIVQDRELCFDIAQPTLDATDIVAPATKYESAA